MVFTILLGWVIFWLAVWVGVFYLISKGTDYINHPFVFAIYFLIFSFPPLYFYRRQLIPLLDNFSIFPFIALFFVLVVTVFSYYISKKYLQLPKKMIKKYPNSLFLHMDYWYVLPKSFEIFFQQSLIIVLVILLSDYGLNIWWIILSFSVLFGVMHAPMIKSEGILIGSYFTVASILSALLFPPLILFVHYGFVYSYAIHWFVYSFSPVMFWKLCPDL